MKRARIHIYLGTTLLPKRELLDDQVAHDIVEVDIGDNEDVKELELVEQRGVYRRRLETPKEARERAALVNDPSTRALVEGLGGTYTADEEGTSSPQPRVVTERLREMTSYRFRLVTLEVTSMIDSAGEEISDADVVEP